MLLLRSKFCVSQYCVAFWASKKFDQFEKVIFVTCFIQFLILGNFCLLFLDAFLRMTDQSLTN